MAKGSDLLVAALENEGVDRIFGVPGEENLDVVESLRNSSIMLIVTRHEQGADSALCVPVTLADRSAGLYVAMHRCGTAARQGYRPREDARSADIREASC